MKNPYYIDYPQEHLEGQAHQYRCAFCKQVTTKINGRLEGHLPSCQYRLSMIAAGYEAGCLAQQEGLQGVDDDD